MTTMELGELQKKVLGHIVNTMVHGNEEKAIVSGLARDLNTDHAVIFRCVQSLEEKDLLTSEQQVKKGKRFLIPTDLGAIVAFDQCDVDYEKWVMKYGDKDAKAEFDVLKRIVIDESARKELYRTVHQFYLNNNLFAKGTLTAQKSAYWNKLTRLEVARKVSKIRKDKPAAINEQEYNKLLKSLDVKLSQLVELET